MRSDKLIDAIGMIDPDLLKKSEQRYKKRKWTRISAWTSAVAALLVVAILVGGLFSGKPPFKNGGDGPTPPPVYGGDGPTPPPVYGGDSPNGGGGNGFLPPNSFPSDENGYVCDYIPDEVDYGGKIVPILVWELGRQYLFPEPDAGEEIHQDIYLGNREIEEDLGIKLDVHFKRSFSGSEDGHELYHSILSRDADYEAAVCQPHFMAMLTVEGALRDLYMQDFPMLEMPWYPTETWNWEISDRLFFVANNSSIQNILSSWVVFVNRDMLGEKGLAGLEESVLSGEWTLEKMRQYSRHWTTEAGNNTASIGDEGNLYGLGIYDRTAMDAFFYSSRLAKETLLPCALTGERYFGDRSIARISALCDSIVALCNSPEVFIGTGESGMETAHALANRNTAMIVAPLGQYRYFPDHVSYTTLVMPKLDTDPSTPYYTVQTEEVEAWCLPYTATDYSIGGLLIEASASKAYRTISPAWFDNYFKYKYSNSDAGVRIFELIRQSHTTDLFRAYSAFLSPYEALRGVMDTSEDQPTPENSFADAIKDADGQLRDFRSRMEQILNGSLQLPRHSYTKIEDESIPATHFETGLTVLECACGDRITRVAPIVKHVHNRFDRLDAERHSSTCECGHTLYEEHAWYPDQVILDETTGEPVQQHYICYACRATKVEELQAETPHTEEPSADGNGCAAAVAEPLCLMLLISLAGVAFATKKKKY